MGNGEGGRGSQTTHISYLAFPVPIPMPFTILPFTLTATIGLISKKQFYKCSTLFCTFFRRCFARLQRETSSYTFHGGNVVCAPVNFFFTAAHFTLVAASINSHFLTAAIKFSCFSSNEIGLRCCFCCFLLLLLLAYFSL